MMAILMQKIISIDILVTLYLWTVTSIKYTIINGIFHLKPTQIGSFIWNGGCTFYCKYQWEACLDLMIRS